MSDEGQNLRETHRRRRWPMALLAGLVSIIGAIALVMAARTCAPDVLSRALSPAPVQDDTGGHRRVDVIIHGPVDMTGSEALERALPRTLQAAVSRANAMASGLNDMFIYWPEYEHHGRRAKLRLVGDQNSGHPTWPVDHILFPWKVKTPDLPPDIKFVSASLYQEEQRQEEKADDQSADPLELAIEVQLATTDRVVMSIRPTHSSIGPDTYHMICQEDFRKSDLLIAESDNVVLGQVVDMVASCLVAIYLANRRWTDDGPVYENAYPELFSITDIKDLADMIGALERYANFISAPEKRTSKAQENLQTALEEFERLAKQGTEGQDFIKYMLIHASTAAHGSYSGARMPGHDHWYIASIIDEIYQMEPYQDDWAMALALEHHEPDRAMKTWDKVVNGGQKSSARTRPADADAIAVVQSARIKRDKKGEFHEALKARKKANGRSKLAKAAIKLENGVDYLGLAEASKEMARLARLHRGLDYYRSRVAGTIDAQIRDLDRQHPDEPLKDKIARYDAWTPSMCNAESTTCHMVRETAEVLFQAAHRQYTKAAHTSLRGAASLLADEMDTLCEGLRSMSLAACGPKSSSHNQPQQRVAFSMNLASEKSTTESRESQIREIDDLLLGIATTRSYMYCQDGNYKKGKSIVRDYKKMRPHRRADITPFEIHCTLLELMSEVDAKAGQRSNDSRALYEWILALPAAADLDSLTNELVSNRVSGEFFSAVALSLVEYAELWEGLVEYAKWINGGGVIERGSAQSAENVIEALRKKYRNPSQNDLMIENAEANLTEIWFQIMGHHELEKPVEGPRQCKTEPMPSLKQVDDIVKRHIERRERAVEDSNLEKTYGKVGLARRYDNAMSGYCTSIRIKIEDIKMLEGERSQWDELKQLYLGAIDEVEKVRAIGAKARRELLSLVLREYFAGYGNIKTSSLANGGAAIIAEPFMLAQSVSFLKVALLARTMGLLSPSEDMSSDERRDLEEEVRQLEQGVAAALSILANQIHYTMDREDVLLLANLRGIAAARTAQGVPWKSTRQLNKETEKLTDYSAVKAAMRLEFDVEFDELLKQAKSQVSLAEDRLHPKTKVAKADRATRKSYDRAKDRLESVEDSITRLDKQIEKLEAKVIEWKQAVTTARKALEAAVEAVKDAEAEGQKPWQIRRSGLNSAVARAQVRLKRSEAGVEKATEELAGKKGQREGLGEKKLTRERERAEEKAKRAVVEAEMAILERQLADARAYLAHVKRMRRGMNRAQEISVCRPVRGGARVHPFDTCLDRFFAHTLVSSDSYQFDKEGSDYLRPDTSDFNSAYHAWGRHGHLAESAAVALWWSAQDDELSDGVGSGIVGSSDFFRLLVLVADYMKGEGENFENPRDAVVWGREIEATLERLPAGYEAMVEIRLLRLQSMVAQGKLAKAAQRAKALFDEISSRRSSQLILYPYTYMTIGDALAYRGEQLSRKAMTSAELVRLNDERIEAEREKIEIVLDGGDREEKKDNKDWKNELEAEIKLEEFEVWDRYKSARANAKRLFRRAVAAYELAMEYDAMTPTARSRVAMNMVVIYIEIGEYHKAQLKLKEVESQLWRGQADTYGPTLGEDVPVLGIVNFLSACISWKRSVTGEAAHAYRVSGLVAGDLRRAGVVVGPQTRRAERRLQRFGVR